MKVILSYVAAFVATYKVSSMLTLPLDTIPTDWKLMRFVIFFCIAGSFLVAFCMFAVFGLEFAVRHWPF